MPITLGCPSCGKRFRARDESAGKRVKCPFCQAAVSVPTSAEAEAAGAPTEVVPPPKSGALAPPEPRAPVGYETILPTPPVPPPPQPVAAATPSDWGAPPPQPAPPVLQPILEPIEPPKPPKPVPPLAPPRKARQRPATEQSAPELTAAAWRRARGGLGWVLFGLFWFALIGFVPFGKFVYERSVGPLPGGEGWVKINGYVNVGQDSVKLDRREELNLLLYGVPVLVGGLAVVLGRLTAAAVPRSSGAKGLFAFSGLFALLALAGAGTWKVSERVNYHQLADYGWWAVVLGAGLSEFWFLLGLGAAAATVRRPKAVRGVGLFALVVGVAVLVYFVGWDVYLREIGPRIGRPRKIEAGSDWQMYEEAARMLGWVVVVGAYWRAVRGVRAAIREFVEDTADRAALTPER